MAEPRELYGPLAHLPPRDSWRQNPDKLQKFYAPTDDRGFVQPNATIEAVLELFEDEYAWPVDWQKDALPILRPDDHHFHWVANLYSPGRFKGSKRDDLPQRFRNLPPKRGLLPRQFHNVIHKITMPPRVPKLSRMEAYLQSYETAIALFSHAERALRLESLMDDTDDNQKLDSYVRQYDDAFRLYSTQVKRALGINAFRIIGVGEDFNPYSLAETQQALGSCALLNVPNYTNAYFQYPKPTNGSDMVAA